MTLAFGQWVDAWTFAGQQGSNDVGLYLSQAGEILEQLSEQLVELEHCVLSRKGFSLVEVMSPCPTQFGRRNDMKETQAMLHSLRDRSMPVAEFRALPPAARARKAREDFRRREQGRLSTGFDGG